MPQAVILRLLSTNHITHPSTNIFQKPSKNLEKDLMSRNVFLEPSVIIV